MTVRRTFRAFFSYARDDAAADPKLVDALTTDLQRRVNVKFANDRFEIWRDTEGLRLGDRWDPKIEGILRASDILIVLLTPRWLGSAYCCKEYDIFEEVEAARGTEDFTAGYVASILARDLEKEKSNLTPEQSKIFASIRKRQYQRLLASDFLVLARPRRNKIVDEIADDIQGIIERCRTNPDKTRMPAKVPRKRNTPATEFDVRAYNFDEIDLVSNAEVVLDRRKMGEFALYAQIDLSIDSMYRANLVGSSLVCGARICGLLTTGQVN
jgi:TIR domain